MMKQVLIALFCLAPVAHAQGAMRDIFGINMCSHLPAAYHLQKGDATCPRTATITRTPMEFTVPELGMRASYTNDFVTQLGKGKLGGMSASVYRRLGEIDCGELGLDCRGMVDISRVDQLDWTDSCSEFSVKITKRYTQSSLLSANVVRSEVMNCLYRQ